MTHKYQENDHVALVDGFTDYLPAGSAGVVFCLYTTVPPAYEINFVDTAGQSVGGVFYEDEIEALPEAQLLVERGTAAVN